MNIQEVIGEIERHYALDQKSGRKAVKPGDIPISYEAITPEWLTHIICTGTQGAKVVSYSLDIPDNGSSNRRRIFIEYNAAGQDAQLPKTVFCKGSVELMNRIMLCISGCAKAEIVFYNNLRPLLDIEAPVSLFAGYDPKSFASIVMLKDLGTEAEFCTAFTPMNWERALSQVTLLAKFHGRFLESPELDRFEIATWAEMWGLQADNDLGLYSDKGFMVAEEVIPRRLYHRYKEIWPKTALSVEMHKDMPQTFAHGDVHLKNWYVRGKDNMGLSDWQVVSKAHWSRDLCYTISTALTVEQRRLWEKDLVKAYLTEMAETGAAMPSFDTAWTYYRQQLLAALAFWTVTLTPAPTQPEMQPRDVTMEFIKRIAHAIDDLDALDSF